MTRTLFCAALLAALCCNAEADPGREVPPAPVAPAEPDANTPPPPAPIEVDTDPHPDEAVPDEPYAPRAVAAPAGGPPCGDTASRSWVVRWRALPADAGVTAYVLVRGPPEADPLPERIPLPTYTTTPDAPLEPVLAARVDGWDPLRAWAFALHAIGPGGESPPSNRLTIPAQVSGPCPPTPAPTLLDITLILARIEQRATEVGAADIADEARKLRKRIESEGLVAPVQGSP